MKLPQKTIYAWANDGPTVFLPLGLSWQPTLGHCRFARRRNVGPIVLTPVGFQPYTNHVVTLALLFANLLSSIMIGYHTLVGTGWFDLGKVEVWRKEKCRSEEMVVGHWLNIDDTCKQRQINVIFINVVIDVYCMACCF